MNKRKLWSRILNIVGLAMIVVGAVSVFRAVLMPALLVLPVIGSGLVALTAFLGRSRYRKFLYAALVLTVSGLIASYGAIVVTLDPSFDLPYRPWWVYVAVAYPIGAIMSLVGAALVIIESFHRPPDPDDGDGTV